MLAISVREALRAAVAAFGAGGIVELASPATPEAVFWAIESDRACATTPESCRSVDSGVVSAARVPAPLRAQRSE